MLDKTRNALLSALLAATTTAQATPTNGEFLRLSFTGDGTSPSASQLFDSLDRTPVGGRFSGTVSPTGSASYAIPFATPPALLSPSLQLSYSTETPSHSWVARGWSVTGTMTVTRITGLEARDAYADVTAEDVAYRISGGGADAILFKSNGVWTTSSGPGREVIASCTQTECTVTTNGRTTKLEADNTIDWSQRGTSEHELPVTYREVETRDVSGNTVRYAWEGSRLFAVEWGGATDASGAYLPGEGSLYTMELVYADRPLEPSYRSVEGRLETIDLRLQDVVLRSTGAVPEIQYELNYVTIDHERMLWGVVEREMTSGESRQLAALEYASYATPTAGDHYVSTEYTEGLGKHRTEVRDGTKPALASTVGGLWDTTGDGLLDYLSVPGASSFAFEWSAIAQATGDWAPVWTPGIPYFVGPGGTNPGEPTVDWVDYLDGTGDRIDETMSFKCAVDSAQRSSASYTMKKFADVDSDGFEDLILVNQLPAETWDWIPGQEVPLTNCAEPLDASSDSNGTWSWTVYRGTETGWATPTVLEVPVPFPTAGHVPVLPSVDPSQLPPTYEQEGNELDLMDMDGDGWLDIVHIEQIGASNDHEINVYYHLGSHGMGWDDTAVSLSAGHGLLELAVGSTSSSILETVPEYTDPLDPFATNSPRIAAVQSVAGFTDINGDGLPDYVDTRAFDATTNPTWDVWLGTGSREDGFFGPFEWSSAIGYYHYTDEGRPAVTVCQEDQPDVVQSFDVSCIEDPACAVDLALGDGGHPQLTCNMDPGAPAIQEVGLVDMDGDGRADLVDSVAGEWWRNTGSGFHATAFNVPFWFTNGLHQSESSQFVFLLDTVSNPATYDETVVHPSQTLREVTWSVRDFNLDGLPDGVGLQGGYYSRPPTTGDTGFPAPHAPLGEARPGLLTGITTTYGARTELAFETSARSYPSGSDQVSAHDMPRHRTVVSARRVTDPVTNNVGEHLYTYEDGVWRGGAFWGFRQTAVEQYEVDTWVHGVSGAPQARSRNERFFLLDRDYAVLGNSTVFVDQANPELVAAPVPPDWHPIWTTENTWDSTKTVGAYGEVSEAWQEARCLREGAEGTSYERSVMVDLARDGAGNVETSTYRRADVDLGGGPTPCHAIAGIVHSDEDVQTSVTWALTSDGSQWVPTSMATAGWKESAGAWEQLEYGELAYDNQVFASPPDEGLFTGQRVCSLLTDESCDPNDDGDWLQWSFFRSSRGAIDQIWEPGGAYASRRTLLTLTHGDALTATEENALGHTTTYEHDSMGRVVRKTGPNGVVWRTEHDGFGRPTAEFVQPRISDTAVFEYQRKAFRYFDTTWNPRVEIDDYRPWTWGAVDELTTVQLLDGFGDVVQLAEPSGSMNWTLVDTIRSIDGTVVRQSYPHFSATLPTGYQPYNIFSEVNSYDGLGRIRSSWSDHQAGLGHVVTSYSAPGEVVTTDAENYQRRLALDTHGRIRLVQQGQAPNALTDTGWYDYDGRGRVTGFEDAEGNTYDYSFDQAGRLSNVHRTADHCGDLPATCDELTPQLWYSYRYDAADPIEMWEGPLDSGTLAVEWWRDELRRPTAMNVWNHQTGAMDAYGWTYDTHWLGAVDSETDPAGTTTYDVYGHGILGSPTTISRTWTGSGHSATMLYNYDLDGKVMRTIWPSGIRVDNLHRPDGFGLDSHRVDWDGSGTWDYIDIERDPVFDMVSGWYHYDSGAVLEQTSMRSNPTTVDSMSLSGPATTHDIAYEYYDNGALERRSFSNGLGSNLYFYDALQRVSGVNRETTTSGWNAEDYVYDTLGNLTDMTRWDGGESDDGVWTYEQGPFSQVSKRISASGKPNHLHTYDAMGRMGTWSTTPQTGFESRSATFKYDGLGRLVWAKNITWPGMQGAPRFKKTDIVRNTYDAADNLVLETHSFIGKGDIHRFRGYRWDSKTGTTIETLAPMLRAEDGTARWVFTEADGHAVATWDADLTTELDFELLGAYGAPLTDSAGVEYDSGDWPIDGYHGTDGDPSSRLLHFGARHVLDRGDGTWLQPEPLLYLGMTNGDLARPLFYSGVYAAGDPVNAGDWTGRFRNDIDMKGTSAALADTSALMDMAQGEVCDANCQLLVGGPAAVYAGAASLALPGPEDVALAGAGAVLGKAALKGVGDVFGALVRKLDEAFPAPKAHAMGKGGGRGGNQFRGPDPSAEGLPHSRFRTDEKGVTTYETYDYPEPGQGKRVDAVGPPHGGVETPHTVDTTVHVNPKDPSKSSVSESRPRPSTPDETPKRDE